MNDMVVNALVGVARVPGTELALGGASTPDSGSLYPETIPDGRRGPRAARG
jgi:hypothetical protein